jgi:hypothetical protein
VEIKSQFAAGRANLAGWVMPSRVWLTPASGVDAGGVGQSGCQLATFEQALPRCIDDRSGRLRQLTMPLIRRLAKLQLNDSTRIVENVSFSLIGDQPLHLGDSAGNIKTACDYMARETHPRWN